MRKIETVSALLGDLEERRNEYEKSGEWITALRWVVGEGHVAR